MGTFLLPKDSISWLIFDLNVFNSFQLESEFIAYNTINASPVARDESKKEVNSSCPAVSTISTS